MATNSPKVTFLLPIRWLTGVEEKPFLGENLRRQITRGVGKENVEELEGVLAYKVVISYQSYKPITIPLTKAFLQTALKPLFPNARCLGVEEMFVQHRSKTMQPLLDFQLYF